MLDISAVDLKHKTCDVCDVVSCVSIVDEIKRKTSSFGFVGTLNFSEGVKSNFPDSGTRSSDASVKLDEVHFHCNFR